MPKFMGKICFDTSALVRLYGPKDSPNEMSNKEREAVGEICRMHIYNTRPNIVASIFQFEQLVYKRNEADTPEKREIWNGAIGLYGHFLPEIKDENLQRVMSLYGNRWAYLEKDEWKQVEDLGQGWLKQEAKRHRKISGIAKKLRHVTGLSGGNGKSRIGRGVEDSIHVITACMNGAKCFITTDKELYRYRRVSVEKALQNMGRGMKIFNPIAFLNHKSSSFWRHI